MQVINCAAWHDQQRRQAVGRRDSMAAIHAQYAEFPLLKQVKIAAKEKEMNPS